MAIEDAALDDVIDRGVIQQLERLMSPFALGAVKLALKLAYLNGAQQASRELGAKFDETLSRVQAAGRIF